MKQKTTVGTICKVVAIIILILGLIGALVLAAPSETAERYGSEFNLGLWFGASGATGLFSLMLYALGDIVDYLAALHDTTAEVYDVLCKNANGKQEDE